MTNLFNRHYEYELTQQHVAERRQQAAQWRAVRNAQTSGSFWHHLRQLRFLLSMGSHVITWSPPAVPVDEALYS